MFISSLSVGLFQCWLNSSQGASVPRREKCVQRRPQVDQWDGEFYCEKTLGELGLFSLEKKSFGVTVL